MKTLKLAILIIATVSFLSSCKRDNPSGDDTNTGGELKIAAKDMVVPTNFNFETEKELNINVAVANVQAGERYVIKVYTSVPSAGDLVSTGYTDAQGKYSTKVRVAAWEDFIYIEKINPDGSSYYERVKANQFVTTTMNNPAANPYIIRKSGSGMDCNTGCTNTVSNLNSSSTINSGQTNCYTGTLTNANITVKSGATAKICGSGTISTLTIEGSGKVYILEGTILSITNANFNNKDNEFYSWSDSLKLNTGNVNGKFYVYGKTYFNNTFNPNSVAEVKNYGLLKVTGDATLSKKVYNYDKFVVGGNLTVTSVTEYKNYCYTYVAGNFTNSNGDIYNSSYIKVLGLFTENSNGSHTMSNGALLSTNNLTVNGKIEGSGSNRSKIKVASTTIINNNGQIKDKIDLCDSNGVETNNGTIGSGAALSCTGYIAPSTCNPEGFGQPAIQDADGDGVADGQDEYPNDPARAFNSYYPNANSTATLAFEDLWPATGDYDFNDLVLAFNIQKVLNADNKVVDYKVKMKVRAIGASFDNGFGFRLDDILPTEINSVTGQTLVRSIITNSANGTESGQDRAVVICYDSPEPSLQRAAGSFFNTIPTNGVGTSDTMRVTVNFTTPVVDSKLGIEKFNPFIFTNRRRGYEIHLGNFKPTSLADSQLFGTQQDRSNTSNNTYYKTANGMPWAILLPEDFAYPIERTPITDAYNYFDDWGVNGGSTNTNWYTTAPGNRNSSYIYGVQ